MYPIMISIESYYQQDLYACIDSRLLPFSLINPIRILSASARTLQKFYLLLTTLDSSHKDY